MNKIFLHADDYGRSAHISKTILNCVRKGLVNSISIIVTENKDYLYIIKKLRVRKKLHINLTDFTDKNSTFYHMNFWTLLILPYIKNFKLKKNKIRNEIIRQILIFKKIYNQGEISVDSHQHIHMIPWLFEIIFELAKIYNIKDIRVNNEVFSISSLFKIPTLNIFTNLIKFLLLKFFTIINYNKTKHIGITSFIGIISTGFQTCSNIILCLNNLKKRKIKNSIEILIHPGYTKIEEKEQFKKSFFEYYSSNERLKEHKLAFSKKLRRAIKLHKNYINS